MKQFKNIEEQTPYKAVSHVAKVLSCLSDGNNSVTAIAQGSGLSKSIVSRLLEAMQKSNFVIRDPVHRKYFLGPFLGHIVANPKTTHLNLITLAIGEMNRLSEITGETVNLGILMGIQHIRLHIIPSKHNIRVYDDDNITLTSLAFSGAATKALLSQLNQKDLTIMMNNVEMEKITDSSSFDNMEYIQQIDQIKKQGYAVSRGERIPGAMMIAAPIKDYQFPAVLSIMGVDSRLKSRAEEFIPEIVASANHISRNLPKTLPSEALREPG
jgi:IclR family transcriptional regulator, KDG regulon repressor